MNVFPIICNIKFRFSSNVAIPVTVNLKLFCDAGLTDLRVPLANIIVIVVIFSAVALLGMWPFFKYRNNGTVYAPGKYTHHTPIIMQLA